MKQEECSEQIQEDIITYMSDKFSTGAWRTESLNWDDDLCQIVVDNFKKMED